MYRPKYRCLLCGAYEYGEPVKEKREADALLNRTVFLGGQFGAPPPCTTHKCNPNMTGVMILEGYVGGFADGED